MSIANEMQYAIEREFIQMIIHDIRKSSAPKPEPVKKPLSKDE